MKKLLAIAILVASGQAQASQTKVEEFMHDVGYCSVVLEVAKKETNAGKGLAKTNALLSAFGSKRGMNAKQALDHCTNVVETFSLLMK